MKNSRSVRTCVVSLLLLASSAGAAKPASYTVMPLSKNLASEYKLNTSFYTKATAVEGVLIATSAKVSDHAHREAAYQFATILKSIDPKTAQRIRDRGVLCLLIGHKEFTSDLPQFASSKTGKELDFYNWRSRGFLSWKAGRPTVVIAEEDVLEYEGGMRLESILIHEFGHVIHGAGFDKALQNRLTETYKRAKAKGLWNDGRAAQRFRRVKGDSPVRLLDALAKWFPDKSPKLLAACLDGGDILVNGKPTRANAAITGKDKVLIVFGGAKDCYAGKNRSEYWAEGVQSWYDTNRTMDHDHNHIHTRRQLKTYDPGLAALCKDVLGDSPWRFVSPRKRAGAGHLAGFDPATTPTVVDPVHIENAAYDYYDKYWHAYWDRLRDKHGMAREDADDGVTITGERKQWHKVTLTLDGPFAREIDDAPNPFLDYRMTVTFTHESGAPRYTVPGYFAADGQAGETSAAAGDKWRAHLAPDKSGKWMYRVSFVAGTRVAGTNAAGKPVKSADGKTGSFTIAPTDKTGRDFRGKGRLNYVGKHHLRFAGNGKYFLKCGTDAPENLLAYADFDGPFKTDGQKDKLIKSWAPHATDWRPGDPTWGAGKGKGLIGALNYLAAEGLNAVSFLPMNIGGDDRNVFPYTTYDDRTHIDCSRMDQWEIVFAHADRMGLHLHFKTQETENELLLDKGDLGVQRTLYYRELIARFSHHLAMNWNLGEEINNATTAQKKAWAAYFHKTDPYRHPIVIHNGANHHDLLGPGSKLTGFSLQTDKPDFSQVHRRTANYIARSAKAGKPWVVACDEPGDASHSLRPDNDAGTSHTNARKNALWGNIMAGGAGLEFYFGYKHAHSDLTCQDFRSRDRFWDYCRYALEFFDVNAIPFWEMSGADDLLGGTKPSDRRYCLAKPGEVYLVYLANGGSAKLDLGKAKGPLSVQWYNPRKGGALQSGSVRRVTGGGTVDIGQPPAQRGEDWLAVIRRQ